MSGKISLIGIGMALLVRLAAAANVVYVSSFDNDTVLKFNALSPLVESSKTTPPP